MTRAEFPAAVAAAVRRTTGLEVSEEQVRGIAIEVWDVSQAGARDNAQFKAALIAGTHRLVQLLGEVYEAHAIDSTTPPVVDLTRAQQRHLIELHYCDQHNSRVMNHGGTKRDYRQLRVSEETVTTLVELGLLWPEGQINDRGDAVARQLLVHMRRSA